MRVALVVAVVVVTRSLHAQEAPPPPPEAPPSATPPHANPDADLLGALVRLFDPFVAIGERRGALTSPALRDPRAIAPLVFLMSDDDAGMRGGAAHALGMFADDPRVERALIAEMRQRNEDPSVRAAAIDALAQRGGPASGEALYQLYTSDDEPLALRNAAKHALEIHYPELLANRGGGAVVDRRGRGLLSAGGAALGSFALASVGALGQNDAGTAIGALGGIVVGGGAAFLLTRSGEITPAQAGWIDSGGVWGAGLGMLAAGASKQGPSTRYVLSFGLAGEVLGTAATIFTRDQLGYTGGDVAAIDISGLLGMDLALGAYYLQDRDRGQVLSGSLLGAGLAGLAIGGAVTPHLSFHSHGDRMMPLLGAYEGLATGLLLPYVAGVHNDNREAAGAFLGAGLGFIGGAAIAQFTDLRPRDIALAWLLGGYGKLAGLSVPLLADGNSPALAQGTIAGSILALGAATALVPDMHFDRGDALLVPLGTGLGLWHGLAFGVSSVKLSDKQETGLALLGLSAGGLGTLALTQKVALSRTEVLVLGGGAFWGNWFTLWGTELAKNPADRFDLRPVAVVGDVGLAASALLLQHVDARRIAVANIGGLAGAGLASLGAALATKNDHAVITANLIGSGAGLVGGALLASTINFAPQSSAVASSGGRASDWQIPAVAPMVVAPPSHPAIGLSLTFVR